MPKISKYGKYSGKKDKNKQKPIKQNYAYADNLDQTWYSCNIFYSL